MEVRQARYFIAVAEELHFGRAAQRLHMSQPPLSQAIQALERDLGAPLLRRTSRQVTLTKAGEVFLAHCRLLVQDAERARAAVEHARDGLSGRLVIAAVASAFTDVLPAALRHYRALRPDVRLRLVAVDTETGARGVQDRTIDIALVRRATGGPGYRAVPLHHDRFVAAVPLDHPAAAQPLDPAAAQPLEPAAAQPLEPAAARTLDPAAPRLLDHPGAAPAGRPLDLGDLAGEPWVWIPREISPGYHDEVVAACRRAGFSPDARHEATTIATQLDMIGCGLGVAIVPSLVAATHRNVVTRPLREPVPLVALSLLVSEDADPLVDDFVATVVSGLVPGVASGLVPAVASGLVPGVASGVGAEGRVVVAERGPLGVEQG